MRTPAIGSKAVEIRRLVQEAAEPEGFPEFELLFGEDSTGNPAVWISFLMESTANPTPEDLRSLRRLRKSVERALFESGTDLTPYIRFREAAGRAR